MIKIVKLLTFFVLLTINLHNVTCRNSTRQQNCLGFLRNTFSCIVKEKEEEDDLPLEKQLKIKKSQSAKLRSKLSEETLNCITEARNIAENYLNEVKEDLDKERPQREIYDRFLPFKKF